MKRTNITPDKRQKVELTDKQIIIDGIRYSRLFAEPCEIYFNEFSKSNKDYLRTALSLQIVQNHNMLLQQAFAWIISIRTWINYYRNNDEKSIFKIIFKQDPINPGKIRELQNEFESDNNSFIRSFYIIDNFKESKHKAINSKYLGLYFKVLFEYAFCKESQDFLADKLHHVYNKTKHGCLLHTTEINNLSHVIVTDEIISEYSNKVDILPFFFPLSQETLWNHWYAIDTISYQLFKLLSFHYYQRFGDENYPKWLIDRLESIADIELKHGKLVNPFKK